jgi:hypothetical protein
MQHPARARRFCRTPSRLTPIPVAVVVAGCARVPGDEEEDGIDDLENEFSWAHRHDSQYVAESMLRAHMSYGRGGAEFDGPHQPFQPIPNVPLLTNGQMVSTRKFHALLHCASPPSSFCFA